MHKSQAFQEMIIHIVGFIAMIWLFSYDYKIALCIMLMGWSQNLTNRKTYKTK